MFYKFNRIQHTNRNENRVIREMCEMIKFFFRLFNQILVIAIYQGEAVAALDAALKHGEIMCYVKIINQQKNFASQHGLHNKDMLENTIVGNENIQIIRDYETIKRKGTSGSIQIAI